MWGQGDESYAGATKLQQGGGWEGGQAPAEQEDASRRCSQEEERWRVQQREGPERAEVGQEEAGPQSEAACRGGSKAEGYLGRSTLDPVVNAVCVQWHACKITSEKKHEGA